MPFGKYKDFRACCRAVKKKGIKHPEAYCATIEHNILGHWPGEKIMREHFHKVMGRR